MSGDLQKYFGAAVEGFFKGVCLQEQVRGLPMNYIESMTQAYDTLQAVRPELRGASARLVDCELERMVNDMDKAVVGFSLFKELLDTPEFEQAMKGLEKRVQEYKR